ncbi:MAG TPA: sulfite exporter TauE/SafE family protein [Propionibacteriaceae bacterium]|nr:sulfite exporter TauE/SafE family protein [Propionibacteriaceae bacterium]
MTWLDLLVLLGAGGLAGLINTVVGAGTLITFPTLLALGVPPVLANVSNTVGLAPGSLSGAWATRRELDGQRRRVLWLGSASLLGGIAGAWLLLWLPSKAFDAIVPILIGLGCVLVVLQPFIAARLAYRRARLGTKASAPVFGSVLLWLAIALVGVYGGYFGAAQGVLLIAILGIGFAESLARINAIKNVLATVANMIAGLVFVIVSEVNWPAAIAIAVGSVIGAQVGGKVSRRLPAVVYRVIIVAVGVVAIVSLLT